MSNDNDIDGTSEGGRVDVLVVLVRSTDCADGTADVIHCTHKVSVGVAGMKGR